MVGRSQQRYLVLTLMILCGLSFWYFGQSVVNEGLSLHTHLTGSRVQPHKEQQQEQQQQPPAAKGQSNEASSPEVAALAAAIEELDPCTVINPISHGFIDLSSLSSLSNEGKALPWTAKGYDKGHNFTLGICSTPFKNSQLTNQVVDVDNTSLVGGFYSDPKTNKVYSIGDFSQEPVFRGRKLTLTYSGGSYCQGIVNATTNKNLRKSTVLSFTCDREMSAKASISYIGSLHDCSYFFEVRSHHACPTAAKANNLAVIWIFLFILLAALAVYCSGGLFYHYMKKQKSEKA
ncbi:MRH domain-containing protein [[Candida] zeylanoides]